MTALDPKANGPPYTNRRPQTADHFHLQALAEAVVAAAWQIDETMLAPLDATEGKPLLNPRAILAILTFCYAHRIYGSAEVAARLRSDSSCRRLCEDKVPDANSLRRFRAQNRLALNFCLKAALRFLAEEKMAQGLVAGVKEERLAREASRRIVMAMFTDSLDLDNTSTRVANG